LPGTLAGTGDLAGPLLAAIGVFAGTNVDDIIVLTVLFLSARASGRPRPGQIWAGQYLGIALLVAMSAMAALGLTIVPDRWVGLLGLVPFALGIRGFVVALRARHDPEPPESSESAVPPELPAPPGLPGLPAPAVATGLASVIGLTLANGADNISVYTPMFRTLSFGDSLLTVAVFAIGVALWCLAGSWLGSHHRVVDVVQRFGHWIVPAVFMSIGAVIVLESGVLTRIAGG
jgi:cadmium resistance protein CadD (predicted permease)